MAEFRFYGTKNDSIDLVKLLFQILNVKLLVDTWYKEPVPIEIPNTSYKNIKLIIKYKVFYIWSDLYSVYSPIFTLPNQNQEYRLDLFKWGPVLSFDIPKFFRENNRICLRPGGLFYPLYFIHPETQEFYKPTDALKCAFLCITKNLKKSLFKRYMLLIGDVADSVKSKYITPLWIGKEALNGLDAGEMGILSVKNRWRTGKEIVNAREELLKPIEER
jgi:hypothetical protein